MTGGVYAAIDSTLEELRPDQSRILAGLSVFGHGKIDDDDFAAKDVVRCQVGRGPLNDEEFETLLNRARTQRRFDVLSWLVLGGLVGLRPYEVLRLERFPGEFPSG